MRKTDYTNAYAQYTYDGSGVSNGKGQRTKMERYDLSGGLLSKSEWTYTNRGQQATQTDTVSGLSGTRAFSWAYDTAGRTTSITYPGGEVVDYTYDEAWRQTSVCSAPTSYNICYASYATYTALDQPSQFTLGNNLNQVYTYSSPMQRLQQMQVGPNLGLYNRSYTYDAVGNVATTTNDIPNPTHTNTYTYDHRDRLTRWQLNTSPSVDESYQYDEIGNITNKAGVSYDYGNYTHGSGAGGPYAIRNSGFTYDNNGNMTGSPTFAGSPSRTYVWTPQNLPSSITSGGVTETYDYNADDERIKKVRSGSETYYIAGLYEQEQATGGGSVKQRYYYTFNGQTVAQRETELQAQHYCRLHEWRPPGECVVADQLWWFIFGSAGVRPVG